MDEASKAGAFDAEKSTLGRVMTRDDDENEDEGEENGCGAREEWILFSSFPIEANETSAATHSPIAPNGANRGSDSFTRADSKENEGASNVSTAAEDESMGKVCV